MAYPTSDTNIILQGTEGCSWHQAIKNGTVKQCGSIAYIGVWCKGGEYNRTNTAMTIDAAKINQEMEALKAELDHYKQETEKIPRMCGDWDNYNCICKIGNNLKEKYCPQICPKYRGEKVGE